MKCPAWFPACVFHFSDHKNFGFKDISQSKDLIKAWDICVDALGNPTVNTRDEGMVFCVNEITRTPHYLNSNYGYRVLRFTGSKATMSEVASLPLPLP